MPKQNLYNILELSNTASLQQIKNKYYQLSLKYHPDTNKSSKSIDNFVRISNAYNVLINPQLKQEYDEQLKIHELQLNKSSYKSTAIKQHIFSHTNNAYYAQVFTKIYRNQDYWINNEKFTFFHTKRHVKLNQEFAEKQTQFRYKKQRAYNVEIVTLIFILISCYYTSRF